MIIKRGYVYFANQIRTIDKSRFLGEAGQLPETYIMKIESAVRRHLEL